MISNISFGKIAKYAAFVGFGISGTGFYLLNRVEKNLKGSPYIQKSLEILKSNAGIVDYLGEPIRDGKLNLTDRKNNYCIEKEAKFAIPIKGSKKKGILYLFATRDELKTPWVVQSLEMKIEGEPDKKIVLFDCSKLPNISDLQS